MRLRTETETDRASIQKRMDDKYLIDEAKASLEELQKDIDSNTSDTRSAMRDRQRDFSNAWEQVLKWQQTQT